MGAPPQDPVRRPTLADKEIGMVLEVTDEPLSKPHSSNELLESLEEPVVRCSKAWIRPCLALKQCL